MGSLGDLWVDVRRHLLDAAGLAAAQLGISRRNARCGAAGPFQLLDRHIYRRRRAGGAWGALVLGAVPRIRRHFRTRDFFWLALGMAILATSRPYEGLLICVPALAALAWWWFKKRVPAPWFSCGGLAPAALLLPRSQSRSWAITITACSETYSHLLIKSTGKPMPVAPHFLWQSPQPEPVYRHRIMRDFYSGPEADSEMKWYRDETRSVAGPLDANGIKVLAGRDFLSQFRADSAARHAAHGRPRPPHRISDL